MNSSPRRARVLFSALLILLPVGCSTDQTSVGGGRSQPTILVSAASDLRFAFQELGGIYERETGTRVQFNFGSSGHLAQQIEQGAPVDVFASANVDFVEDLTRKRLIIPETVAHYGRGSIVLWTREDSPLRIERIEDLLHPGLQRIAIANPAHAPYGLAARQALQRAGIWERAQPKLVLGENVNQAFQYAQTGNVDVAVIALSLAIVAPGGRYRIVPQELHAPIDQTLGVVSSTSNEPEARRFSEFVNGPVGRPLLQRFGFVLPEEPR
ncbi:MAG TPA: molybdate ABC transporter substrate-binding protein [Acidobacteriota bacterium]|nr:molybdate ABC transporter substrate-binding protein [Acidobacteriota bacterium]